MNVNLNKINNDVSPCRRDGLPATGNKSTSFRDLMHRIGQENEEQVRMMEDSVFGGNAAEGKISAAEAGGDGFFQANEDDGEEKHLPTPDQYSTGMALEGRPDHSQAWPYDSWMGGISPSLLIITDENQGEPQKDDLLLGDMESEGREGFGRQNNALAEGPEHADRQHQLVLLPAGSAVVSSAPFVDGAAEGERTGNEQAKEKQTVQGTPGRLSNAAAESETGEGLNKASFSSLVERVSPSGEEHIFAGGEEQDLAAVSAMGRETMTNTVSFAGESTQTSAPTEAYSQVGKEILHRLETKSPITFEMQLDPEHLGKIDVKMEWKAGLLTIDIISAKADTHALLSGQAAKLIQSLGLQNVQVEMIQTTTAAQSEAQTQQQYLALDSGRSFSQQQQQGSAEERQETNMGRANALSENGREDAVSQQQPLTSSFQRMNLAV